jgi:hypothetical protein
MPENNHIAYFGLDCMKCGAYIARQTNNDELRRETAARWNKEYNLGIKPEEINCDGCLTEIIGHSNCSIRVCARGKGIMNCAYCSGYPCLQLDKYIKTAPGCKETLDAIRQGRV